MTTQQRAFEVWTNDGYDLVKLSNGHYRNVYTQKTWILWQLAYPEQEASPPKHGEPWSYYIDIPEQQGGYVVEDLNDATGDLANYQCTVTALFPAKPDAVRGNYTEILT